MASDSNVKPSELFSPRSNATQNNSSSGNTTPSSVTTPSEAQNLVDKSNEEEIARLKEALKESSEKNEEFERRLKALEGKGGDCCTIS